VPEHVLALPRRGLDRCLHLRLSAEGPVMRDAPREQTAHGHGAHRLHFSRRGYLTGFLLSVVLTAVPFWLAMTHALDPSTAAFVIIVAAAIQILVHTISFLHVNTASENGWTLLTYMFA